MNSSLLVEQKNCESDHKIANQLNSEEPIQLIKQNDDNKQLDLNNERIEAVKGQQKIEAQLNQQLKNHPIKYQQLNSMILYLSQWTSQKIWKLIRIIYFVILIYTGVIFPILISIGISFVSLQIIIDILSIFYILAKINLRQSYKMNIKNYFKSIEIIQIISIIPFQFWTQPYLKYLYFLKILRLVSISIEIKRTLKSVFGSKSLEFLHMIMTLQIMILWITNFWIFFSKLSDNPESWHNRFCLETQENCFLKAYYFMLYTCVTIGYGQEITIIDREKLLLIFIMIFGVLGFSYCVASFSAYLQEKFLQRSEKQKKYIILQNLNKKLKLNRQNGQNEQNIIMKVRRYINRQNKMDLHNEQNFEIISSLPENIKQSISQNLNNKIFGNIHFFKEFQKLNLIYLVKYMKQIGFQIGQLIVGEGNPSQDLYFIKKGKAGALVSSKYKFQHNFKFAIFKQKSSFGEYQSLPYSKRYMYSILALEYCDIFTISAYQLLPYLEQNPTEYQKLKRYMQQKNNLLMMAQQNSAAAYKKRQSPLKLQEDNNKVQNVDEKHEKLYLHTQAHKIYKLQEIQFSLNQCAQQLQYKIFENDKNRYQKKKSKSL